MTSDTTKAGLWLWLTDRDERRIFEAGHLYGDRYPFRFPWSRLMSVRVARETGWDSMTQTTSEADLFWDDSDPEIDHQDIADIVNNYCRGEIVHIRRAVRLHDVFVVRMGDETRQFDDNKEAEAWVRDR